MIDVLIVATVGIFSTLGGLLIRDLKALLIYTALTALAVFLIAHVTGFAVTVLGLVGLATALVRIGKAGKRVVERKTRTYRSRRRLKGLEEAVKTLPEKIVDVVPSGGARSIHPHIVWLVAMVDNAYLKGYTVEEPAWFMNIKQYLATVGPNYVADKTKVLGEHEIVELD